MLVVGYDIIRSMLEQPQAVINGTLGCEGDYDSTKNTPDFSPPTRVIQDHSNLLSRCSPYTNAATNLCVEYLKESMFLLRDLYV